MYEFNGKDLQRYAITPPVIGPVPPQVNGLDFNGDGASEVVFSDEDAVYVWGVDDSAGLQPWERLVAYLVDDNHRCGPSTNIPLSRMLMEMGRLKSLP